MTDHHSFSEVWRRFEEQRLTHSMTHYILSIAELREERGYARLVDVARRLGITKGAASIGLKALRDKGYVAEDENRILLLTEKGHSAIRSIIGSREALLRFFHEVLGLDEAHALEDACKLEHLISYRTTEALVKFMKNQKRKKKKSAKP
jgi:Mn-dependent DtxR family transcriptional regulator